MRTVVESLRRLYQNGGVTIEKIDGLLSEGKINQDEYNYIIG